MSSGDNSSPTSAAGYVHLTSGSSANSNSGYIRAWTPAATTSGKDTGGISLSTGASAGNSGAIILGTGDASDTAGEFRFEAGQSGTGTTGAKFTIKSGASSASTSTSGNVVLYSADSSTLRTCTCA